MRMHTNIKNIAKQELDEEMNEKSRQNYSEIQSDNESDLMEDVEL